MRRRAVIPILAAAVLAAGAALMLRSEKPTRVASGAVTGVLGGEPEPGFSRAVAPRQFLFPRDHGPHPDFRTEWWYFTGNLKSREGRSFGYQLTLFRVALFPEPLRRSSKWGARDVYMGHFAVSDIEGKRFWFAERFGRAALDLAGARQSPFAVWLEDWTVQQVAHSPFQVRLRAAEGDFSLDLSLRGLKGEIPNGEGGLSRKGSTAGNASYYYSVPRMESSGSIAIGGRRYEVAGLSWLDREWSTSALERDQVGWDWFALQLEDGRDLMFYHLRRRDGTEDPHSAGTLVRRDGSYRELARGEVLCRPLSQWKSRKTGVSYPSRWEVSVPGEGLELEVVPRLADQELAASFRYWEGAVAVIGKNAASPKGVGYLEMTGYAPADGGGALR